MGNTYGMPLVNKKIPDLMKDENNSVIMIKFVGFSAKMYAMRGVMDSKKDTKRAEGIKSNVITRAITFDDYTQFEQRNQNVSSIMHTV